MSVYLLLHAVRMMATGQVQLDDYELKCGICLELFQDPRFLPCLHTFCRECLLCLLNEKSVKCPLCREKHELDEDSVRLLPVNHLATQELPLRRLQQQQQEETSGLRKCQSCEEQSLLVAWCEECDAIICQTCLNQHKKMLILREHHIQSVQKDENETALFVKKTSTVSECPRHDNQKLKYFCTNCSELVCPECLLGVHKNHEFSTPEEARNDLEAKLKNLAGAAANKKKEFTGHLEKLHEIDAKEKEDHKCTEKVVNEMFDAIAASVEAQRNEALQNVSKGLKRICLEKDNIEINLAQLDSFTRFLDHIHKCTTSTCYAAMATQGVKLIERIKEKKPKIDLEDVVIGSQWKEGPFHLPLDWAFKAGQPSFIFLPVPGSEIDCGTSVKNLIRIEVSIEIGGLPVVYSQFSEKCDLEHKMLYQGKVIPTDVEKISQFSWVITSENTYFCIPPGSNLVVQYKLSESKNPEFMEVSYVLTYDCNVSNPQPKGIWQ